MKRTAVQTSAPLPAASSTLPRAGGGVPENVDELAAFNERVNARAQQTAQLVRSLSDMDLVLSQVETEIAQSRQVNAFHVKSSVAAVRAAYRDRPEEELEARLLDLDRRLMELSAKYDPSVREAMVAGAARAH
jgi:hypothetical protein